MQLRFRITTGSRPRLDTITLHQAKEQSPHICIASQGHHRKDSFIDIPSGANAMDLAIAMRRGIVYTTKEIARLEEQGSKEKVVPFIMDWE